MTTVNYNDVKVIAHRGLRVANYAENTIPAFKKAIEVDSEMIELDVYETKDGNFIIHHNDRLNKRTHLWVNLTYEQIRTSVAQSNLAPLLSESIKEISPVPIDIEIKNCFNVNNFVGLIDKLPPPPNSVVSSFNLNTLKKLYFAGCDLPLFLILSISSQNTLIENIRNVIFWFIPKLLPKYLGGVAVHYNLVREFFIKKLHRSCLRVFVWTVDDVDKMKRCISLKVDGIITNYPVRLLKLRNEFTARQ